MFGGRENRCTHPLVSTEIFVWSGKALRHDAYLPLRFGHEMVFGDDSEIPANITMSLKNSTLYEKIYFLFESLLASAVISGS